MGRAGRGGDGAARRKNDGRSSITIVVMGDEGVGKSSLISTFVSRHFSEMVPGIMTRVRLPPDTTATPLGDESSFSRGFVTSIVDTQGGDSALIAALAAEGGGAFPSSSLSPNSSITSLSRAAAPAAAAAGGAAPSEQQKPQDTSSRRSPSSSSNSNNSGSHLLLSSPRRIVSSMEVDVIVLVYDLDRIDTFFRLESHWLPLIERCFGEEVPVIIAGNKIDLRLGNPQHSLSTATSTTVGGGGSFEAHSSQQTDRQRIVALLQRFKFVRQCIKCSAKTLFQVSEIFHKAQHAVLFPITPLYDLREDRLTDDCQRAFVRIFRMMDADRDGLLSSAELKAFQNKCFRVWGPLLDENISGWKKILSKKSSRKGRGILGDDDHDRALIRDGKFTVAGFLAIFDIFMSKDRWEVPWQILRIFGYDDDLELQIPSFVTADSPDAGDGNGKQRKGLAVWDLTPSAECFLASVFHQFDSDNDGVLSEQDILTFFSIIPEPSLPPWHPSRAKEVFRGSFSSPQLDKCRASSAESSPSSVLSASQSLSASGITISSADLIVPGDATSDGAATLSSDGTMFTQPRRYHPHFSFLDWMGYWRMSSVINPTSTRIELYRLGHVEKSKVTRSRSRKKAAVSPSIKSLLVPSATIRVRVFGSHGCGKSALLSALCQLEGDRSSSGKSLLVTEETKTPVTRCSHVRFTTEDFTVIAKNAKRAVKQSNDGGDLIVHVVFTEVPEATVKKMDSSALASACELVVLAFDYSDPSSLTYAFDVEKRLLTDEVPRIFIGTKCDRELPESAVSGAGCVDTGSDVNESTSVHIDIEGTGDTSTNSSTSWLQVAQRHCSDLDIEAPLMISVDANGVHVEAGHDSRIPLLKRLVRCAAAEESGRIPSHIESLRSKPHASEKQRMKDEKRKKIIWIGGFLGVSIIVAVGTMLWPKRERVGWFRNWQMPSFSTVDKC